MATQLPFHACALLAVRNEEQMLARCLDHLASQGLVAAVIDNDSTDSTPTILDGYPSSFLVHRVGLPFEGYFNWQGLLAIKQRLATTLQADWFVHVDADEILEAPEPLGTLSQGLQAVDQAGYNTVNFNEFVFVPENEDHLPATWDYVKHSRWYYFFEPRPHRLQRAWKAHPDIDIVISGGHKLKRLDQRMYPQSFILRHYIASSRSQLMEKYQNRVFSPAEIARGWHRNRLGIGRYPIEFPGHDQLKEYLDDGQWDTRHPWREHFFSPRQNPVP
jgi:glycosyltransferase involved in cell wall biosynthesis